MKGILKSTQYKNIWKRNILERNDEVKSFKNVWVEKNNKNNRNLYIYSLENSIKKYVRNGDEGERLLFGTLCVCGNRQKFFSYVYI